MPIHMFRFGWELKVHTGQDNLPWCSCRWKLRILSNSIVLLGQLVTVGDLWQ